MKRIKIYFITPSGKEASATIKPNKLWPKWTEDQRKSYCRGYCAPANARFLRYEE